jgi:hypothetical protein
MLVRPSESECGAPEDILMATSASQSSERARRQTDEVNDHVERPISETSDDIPRMEPWLWAIMSAFVPALLAFALPRSYLPILFGLAGVLIAAGIGMLIVQERGRQRARSTRSA